MAGLNSRARFQSQHYNPRSAGSTVAGVLLQSRVLWPSALYLAKLLRPLVVRVTRIGRGLPVGGDLEYADQVTLLQGVGRAARDQLEGGGHFRKRTVEYALGKNRRGGSPLPSAGTTQVLVTAVPASGSEYSTWRSSSHST